jgi:hypothetical protein
MVNFYLDKYIENKNGYNIIHAFNKKKAWPWLGYQNEKELNKTFQEGKDKIWNQPSKSDIEKANEIDDYFESIAAEKVSIPRNYEQPSQIDTIFCRVFNYSKNDTTIQTEAETDNRMQMPDFSNDTIIRTQIELYKNKFIDRRLFFLDENNLKLGITLINYNGYDEELKKLEKTNLFESIRRTTGNQNKELLLSQIIKYFNDKKCNVNIFLVACMAYPFALDKYQRTTLKRSYHNDAWGGRQKKRKTKRQRYNRKQNKGRKNKRIV